MAFKLAELFVELGVRSHLDAGLKAAHRQTVAAAAGLSTAANRAGVGLALLGGTAVVGGLAAVAMGLYKGVQGAADLQESVSKVGEVFQGDSAKITGYADKMAAAYGTPKKAILDAASSFGLMAQSAGLANKESADVSVRLSQLAVDATSFYDVPLNVALEKLRSGLTGEAEPLRAFGVLLSEQAVKAEAARLGIARLGAELTESQKVKARISLIENAPSMRKAAGDLERTKDSPKNRQREIGGRVENTLTTVGAAVMPIWKEAVRLVNMAAQAIGAFVEKVKPALMEWSASAISAVRSVALTFYDLLTSAQQFGSSTVIQGWGQAVGGVFGWLKGVVVGLVETVGFVMRNFDGIWALAQINVTEAVANMAVAVQAFVTVVGDHLAWLGRNWLKALKDITNAMGAFFTNLLDNAARFGVALWEAIQGKGFDFKFTPLLDGFKKTMEKLPEIARPIWVDMAKQRELIMQGIGADEARHQVDMARQALELAKGGPEAAARKPAEQPGAAPAVKPAKSFTGGAEEFARHLQAGIFGKDNTGKVTADNTTQMVGLLQQANQIQKGKKPGPGVAVGPA